MQVPSPPIAALRDILHLKTNRQWTLKWEYTMVLIVTYSESVLGGMEKLIIAFLGKGHT